ncbi:MAG TPA: outer membrane beta-barrel protein [Crenalkalicoccus sp.]|nr:outer membrane beta-barrel protein [Crenalkalicoccus sp.]
MKFLSRVGFAGLLLGATGGLPAAAQDIVPGDVARGITVLTRPRPDFDPLGVRLGAFQLDAALESGAGYDSNVFGRSTNVVSDGFAGESANVSLNSLWSTHALGVSGQMNGRQYFSRTELDWTDWNLGGFGRYDFSPYTSMDLRYRHYREHYDVFNFDVQSAGIVRPVPFNSDEVVLSGATQLNRFGANASFTYRTYDFQNVPEISLFPTSLNSFNTIIGVLGGSYAFAPGRYVTAQVQLQDITYTNNAQSFRNSFTYAGLVGVQYDFNGIWQGRLSIGYRRREYQGPGIKPLEGPAVEGELIWAPTLLTTVGLRVSRTIEESIRQNAVSYERLVGGITVDHEYRRNVILSGAVQVSNYNYQAPSQSATDMNIIGGGTWMINRNLALVGSYQYSQRLQATGGFNEFERHLVQFRLRLAL